MIKFIGSVVMLRDYCVCAFVLFCFKHVLVGLLDLGIQAHRIAQSKKICYFYSRVIYSLPNLFIYH